MKIINSTIFALLLAASAPVHASDFNCTVSGLVNSDMMQLAVSETSRTLKINGAHGSETISETGDLSISVNIPSGSQEFNESLRMYTDGESNSDILIDGLTPAEITMVDTVVMRLDHIFSNDPMLAVTELLDKNGNLLFRFIAFDDLDSVARCN